MKKLAAMTFLCALALAPSRARADVDMRVQAGHMLSAMEGDARRVALLLRSARASHAVNAAKCIDGFLSQIDAGVRHGRDDVADLRAAVAQNDLAAARRALSSLAGRREAARWASFSADTCNGQLAATNDQTEVRVVRPPTLPSDRDVFAR